MWVGNRSFQESPVWRKHRICQVEVTFCKMGLLAHNLLNSDGLVSVLFGVLGDRTWEQLSSALCLSISDGGLGDCWLCATLSIECLLPWSEFLWSYCTAGWVMWPLMVIINSSSWIPSAPQTQWVESRWLFKPRLENLGVRDWSSCGFR